MNIRAFFYHLGGSDYQLLEIGSWSERYRHLCRGVLVFIIGVLTFLSSATMLILVLMPRGGVSPWDKGLYWLLCILLAICWSAIVLNIYRFIVSSTGFGDGLQRVGWRELAQALPKFVTALLIGICVCVPMFASLLKSQIDTELSQTQTRIVARRDADVDLSFDERLRSLYTSQAHMAGTVELLTKRLHDWGAATSVEQRARARPPTSGNDVSFSRERSVLEAELETAKKSLIDAKTEVKTMRDEIRKRKDANLKFVKNADTLFNEVEVTFEQQRPLFLFVLSFVLLVHLIPVILQIISIKGPYDYQVEFQNKLVLAKHGIATDVGNIPGQPAGAVMDRYTVAEKIQEDVLRGYAATRTKIRQDLQEKSEQARQRL